MTPYLALARSAPAPAPSLRAGEADVSIDRLSSIVGPEPESAHQQFRSNQDDDGASSRSADQAARAGRSASELPGIGAPRARARWQRCRLTLTPQRSCLNLLPSRA